MADGAAQASARGGSQGIAHVLEIMHPMREPPQPASLAPFAMTLAVGFTVALVLLALAITARRRRASLREAAAVALARTRALAPAERLAAQARLLRQLVRRVAGEAAARLQGAAWLGELDRVFVTTFFTQGAGVAYGDALYGAELPDVEGLDVELAGLFGKLRSPSAPAGARLSINRSASGANPSSDPASRGHPGSRPGQALLPQGEKG